VLLRSAGKKSRRRPEDFASIVKVSTIRRANERRGPEVLFTFWMAGFAGKATIDIG
jgi:hypothetical protein